MTGTPSGGILYGNSLGTGCTVRVGEWYTLMISVQANTSGQANAWHENHPRLWNAEFFRGGAGTPPAEDHFVRIDEAPWNNSFYTTAPSL